MTKGQRGQTGVTKVKNSYKGHDIPVCRYEISDSGPLTSVSIAFVLCVLGLVPGFEVAARY